MPRIIRSTPSPPTSTAKAFLASAVLATSGVFGGTTGGDLSDAPGAVGTSHAIGPPTPHWEDATPSASAEPELRAAREMNPCLDSANAGGEATFCAQNPAAVSLAADLGAAVSTPRGVATTAGGIISPSGEPTPGEGEPILGDPILGEPTLGEPILGEPILDESTTLDDSKIEPDSKIGGTGVENFFSGDPSMQEQDLIPGWTCSPEERAEISEIKRAIEMAIAKVTGDLMPQLAKKMAAAAAGGGAPVQAMEVASSSAPTLEEECNDLVERAGQLDLDALDTAEVAHIVDRSKSLRQRADAQGTTEITRDAILGLTNAFALNESQQWLFQAKNLLEDLLHSSGGGGGTEIGADCETPLVETHAQPEVVPPLSIDAIGGSQEQEEIVVVE